MHSKYLGDFDLRDPCRSRAIIGLGFGDEGKGMAVAHETARAVLNGLDAVNVRFNGGPQAAHNVRVCLCEGKVVHHTHSQFGSGTLLGARTIITDGMLFDPLTLMPESTHLASLVGRDVMDGLTIDQRCPIVMPMHARANHMLERARGDKRHGSTGRGIGVARTCESAVIDGSVDASMAVDVDALLRPSTLLAKMRFWREWICGRFEVDLPDEDEGDAEALSDAMGVIATYGHVVEMADEHVAERAKCANASVIFEGSQGILLDERYGWFPHVTYGDMTASRARRMDPLLKVVGVTRTYATRHGAGPMPGGEGGIRVDEVDNTEYEWAGKFRVGPLHGPSLAKAAGAAKVDEVAASWLDGMFLDRNAMVDKIAAACKAPVTVGGYGNMVHDWMDL